MQTTVVKPVLKWCGNKQGTPVAERVAQLFEPYRDTHLWVEPFIGVGGMLLEIQPEQALCFDLSAEMIGLHRWIKDGGRYINPPSAENFVDRYYQNRLKFQAMQVEYAASPDLIDGKEDLFFSLMIWLNKACFNGLWRVNGDGLFNVPAGKDNNGNLYNPMSISVASLTETYQRYDWLFDDADFALLDRYKAFQTPNKFVYCDPPYFGTHSSYTSKPFNWDDQKRLAHWLASLDCPVVASNSKHPEVLSLYESLGFEIELIEVRRSVAANGDRTAAVEMLAHKNL